MKRTLISLLIFLPLTLAAQSDLAATAKRIAENNTGLKAAAAKVKAESEAARAELRLPDPEAEVAYLVGTPKVTPNRVNATLTQQLDWGVLSGRRRRVAEATAGLSQHAYDAARRDLLAEIAAGLTEKVYFDKLCDELGERARIAHEVEALYQKKYEAGGAGLVELNKVKLNTTLAEGALSRASADRAEVENRLTALNGGLPLTDRVVAYDETPLPALVDLQAAVEKTHPSVAASERAVSLSEEQVRLARAMAWPALSVGYTGEYVKGTGYSGVSLGVSLPLWGNSRARVRQAKAENEMRRLDLTDSRTMLAADVSRQYTKALTLDKTAEQLNRAVTEMSDVALLRRSLDEGKLSLLDYLMELSFYYEARTARLEAERDARLASVALKSYFW